jgi:hypothetical protein
MNNTVTYNGVGSTLDGGYSAQNTSGVFGDYCSLQTDTTLPSSHYMPAGCVTIYSNTAAFNICQSSFMENMPSCDLSGSTKSSTKYTTTALPGFNLCYSSNGFSVFTPFTVTTTTSSNVGGVYSEGAGNFAPGMVQSSHPTKSVLSLSVSAADQLGSFLDFIF